MEILCINDFSDYFVGIMTLEEFFWEPSTSSKFPPELHSPSLNDKTPLLMVHDASSHRPSHILGRLI